MSGISGMLVGSDKNLSGGAGGALPERAVAEADSRDGATVARIAMRPLDGPDVTQFNQPVYDETLSRLIVFDGAIHNSRALRERLKDKGRVAETTEKLILQLYEEYGGRCPDFLRGSFAFAIAEGTRLFIARDRLGVRPLYYAHLKARGLFLFASEIKALLQCPDLNAAVDTKTLHDYLLLGHAFDDHTFFEGIKSLAPGRCLTVESTAAGISIKEGGDYRITLARDSPLSFVDAAEELGAVLAESVKSQTPEGSRVGLALSGGLDSALLALFLRRSHSGLISTFTVADARESSEAKQARLVSNHIGAAHHELLNNFDDSFDKIPDLVRAEEQPGSSDGLPMFLLLGRMNRQAEVCFSGEGADELFGGYSEYLDRKSKAEALRAGLRRAEALGMPPREGVVEFVDRLGAAQDHEEYLECLFTFNLKSQLVNKRLSPLVKYAAASGVELRLPYLDPAVVDFANSLPLAYKVNLELGIRKYVLKRMAVDTFGEVVIDGVLRKKLAFAPSLGERFTSRFEEFCEASLPDRYAERHEMRRQLSRTTPEAGKRTLLVWDLFCFIFIEHRGSIPEGFDFYEFLAEKAQKPRRP